MPYFKANLQNVRCFNLKRILALVLSMLMVLCLFTGCSKDEKDPSAPDVNGDGLNQNEVVSGPINPLTGESVSEDKSDLRPYCVMINNHPDARPAVGLSQASIIYEALAEGGITRMMAVFNDVDGITVGSLRSARPYYISMAQAYDAIYIHAGGSEQAYSDIKSLGIDNMDGVRGSRAGEASSYYRDQTRLSQGKNVEHTLFADGSKLAAFAKNNYDMKHVDGYDTTYGLKFSPDAVSQCTSSATDFTVPYGYYKTNFQYSADKKCYNAFISGNEYIDGGNNSSIDLANVIVLNIPTKTIDSYGRQAMELTGSGSGYFFTEGKYVEINWSRADRADNFHYTLKDGTPLNLSIGKTWISIAPLDSTEGISFN